MEVPGNYKRLIGADDVDTHVRRIATKILQDYDELPLFVALLRGAAPFASKLMFEITRQAPEGHPELDYMMVSTYGDDRTAGEPRIVTDLAPSTEVNGRSVLVIDDVLDKGITANFVFEHLKNRGASDVQLAVLAQKDVQRAHDISASYCAFDLGEKWLTGMGMDDAKAAPEAYRWLEEIWEVQST